MVEISQEKERCSEILQPLDVATSNSYGINHCNDCMQHPSHSIVWMLYNNRKPGIWIAQIKLKRFHSSWWKKDVQHMWGSRWKKDIEHMWGLQRCSSLAMKKSPLPSSCFRRRSKWSSLVWVMVVGCQEWCIADTRAKLLFAILLQIRKLATILAEQLTRQ